MGGPFTEYNKFEDWICRRKDFADILPGSTIIPALKRFGQGLICL